MSAPYMDDMDDMNAAGESIEFRERSERIEYLVARCQAIADEQIRTEVLELLRLVLEWHGRGLRQLLAIAGDAPHLEAALGAWGREADLAALCELHGITIPRRRSATTPPGFVPLEELTHA